MKNSSLPPRSRIAIVGVSALFPGSISTTGFWKDILEGRDLIDDVPASHWLIEDYYDPDPTVPDKTYAKRGAFLKKVDFDAMAWGVPPNIVPETDTSQLLALIVAQQVLQDATRGAIDDIDRSRISVILGVTSGQELLGDMVSRLQRPIWLKALRESGIPEDEAIVVCDRIADHYTPWNESTFPGLLGNVVAGRIANRLDLGGTNCVTDAACASTFSALAMAVQELQLGDSDMVISGGVDTMNDIFMFMCFSKTPALSPTGDCRPFSDKADGTMLGEGLGMFALKRLEDAERDGDQIYAVIDGIGSSSDGRSKSVYAPRPEGQAVAIRRAYAKAGYGTDTVELVEAHGTGTVAGDAAEFRGLGAAFDESGRIDRQWCALGSVKSQIGHTKAAAGAAGLFKAVMALHHKVLPPTIKVEKPNPAMKIEESPFYLGTRARPWVRPSDYPRRASVSSFGFGGSNFHVALSEYDPSQSQGKRTPRLPTFERHLVLLSSTNAAELVSAATDLAAEASSARPGFLMAQARKTQESFQSALELGRAHTRLAVLAEDEADLEKKLLSLASTIKTNPGQDLRLPTGLYYSSGERVQVDQTAFIFPGQGSQYLHMGADLAMHFDAAVEVWGKVVDATTDHTKRNIADVVFPPTAFESDDAEAQVARLAATEWAQPAIGTVSLSMLALLERLGVRPSYTGGHSYGEISALHAAGVLDHDAFLSVSRRRGELMASAAQKPGAMVAVSTSLETITERLDAWDLDLVIANHNGPQQVVLSGALSEIEKAEATMLTENITCRRLPVSTAFHSPIVAGAGRDFAEFLTSVDFHAPRCPVYSNVSAVAHSSDPNAMRDGIAAQLSSRVRFAEMVETMYNDGARTFIEVGPHAVTTGLVSKILGDRPHLALNLDRKGKNGVDSVMSALASLSVAGLALNFQALWSEYATPAESDVQPRPKFAIAINGANHGKPYPPAGGAAELPPPNPPRMQTPAAPREVQAAPTDHVPVVTTHESASTPSLLVPSAHAPSVSTDVAPSGEWLAAYQQTQRETAEAHAIYLKTIADTHALFLDTVERSFSITATAPVAAVSENRLNATNGRTVDHGQPAVIERLQVPIETTPSIPMPSPSPIAFSHPAEQVDLHALMLEVVSEKTGYPTEMLSLEMALEGDLGIDSIKRVEILSTMTDRVPAMPEFDTAVLAKLNTLGQVVEYMTEQLGSPAAAETTPSNVAAVTPVVQVDLHALMLEVVSEKTGYPTEMLSLEMALEGDLGIDSIKRVEILSTMTDRVPAMPEFDTAVLAKLNTLGQVVEYMTEQLGSPAAAETTPSNVAAVTPVVQVDLHALMLEVVSEKTGYPTEMLSLEMALEGDLGIDSIKRVEILSTMTDRVPAMPEFDTAVLAKLNTLGQVVEYMTEQLGSPAAAETASPSVPAATQRVEALGRFITEAVEKTAQGIAEAGVHGEGWLWITGDGSALASKLAAALGRRGIKAIEIAEIPTTNDAGPRGLVFLGGAADVHGIDAEVALNKKAFNAAKVLAASLATAQPGQSLFVTVQDTGGSFGNTVFDGTRAWSAGLAALARTASQEWPNVAVKVIDLERGTRTEDELAEILAYEIALGGPDLDVGLGADGKRRVLQSKEVSVEVQSLPLADGDVVVCSGGGRGVTAATMVELASHARLRFALLGRSPIVEEPECCHGVQDDAALKKILLERAKTNGEKPTPASLRKEVSTITASREIRATLASIEAAGSEARYLAVDVMDATQVGDVLTELRSEWGPPAALIHGAGVLADKTILEKTEEQFDRVFDTKILGLRSLLQATASDPLKLLCVFSSVAARCGNVGQSDYAMANEILNKVAIAESRRRDGTCLVRSLGWGPWEGGMVTPQLKERFRALGVGLIPLSEGAKMFVDECRSAQPDQVELVLGAPPRAGALLDDGTARTLRVELQIDRTTHPYLDDHAIDGVPVVPVALAIEWFARTARACCPNLVLEGLRGVEVLHGIMLHEFDSEPKKLVVDCQSGDESVDSSSSILHLELSDGNGTVFYRCVADMRPQHSVFPASTSNGDAELVLEAWGNDSMYDGEVLFHGPEFQMLQNIEGISDEGLVAEVSGILDPSWPATQTQAPPEPWCTDPLVVDAGLQLALLLGRRVLGGASLPTGIAQVRTFDTPSSGPFRCTLRGRSTTTNRLVSDAVFHDAEGRVVAELAGIETHLLPSRR